MTHSTYSTLSPEGETCPEPAVVRCDDRWFCAACGDLLLRVVAYQSRIRRARAASKKWRTA
jgi:hypothetical protein